MGRVWGERPDEAELAWFYEANPVRPASVLLAEEDGKTVGDRGDRLRRGCRSAARALEVGMPLRVATDPGYRGRGIFARARGGERGARAAARRPAAAHGSERRLGARLPRQARLARAAAAPGLVARGGSGAASRARAARRALRGRAASTRRAAATGCCGTPPGSTGASPTRRRRYSLLEGEGYAVVRPPRPARRLAAVEGDLLARRRPGRPGATR